jgi:hypothetical protein
MGVADVFYCCFADHDPIYAEGNASLNNYRHSSDSSSRLAANLPMFISVSFFSCLASRTAVQSTTPVLTSSTDCCTYV